MSVSSVFYRLAAATSAAAGCSCAFVTAASIVVPWVATGPQFGAGDTGRLVIDTGTSIVTFPLLFPVRNTRGRGSEAAQIERGELIPSSHVHAALRALDDATLDRICRHYLKLGAKGRVELDGVEPMLAPDPRN